MDTTEIRFSKSKISLRLLILGFVIIICAMATRLFEPDELNKYIVWAGLLLCSIAFLYYMSVFLYKKPALIITSKGFINNTNFKSSGLIEWKDVKTIETLQFKSNSKKILVVEINKNDGKSMSININTALLDSTYDEVEVLMQQAIKTRALNSI